MQGALAAIVDDLRGMFLAMAHSAALSWRHRKGEDKLPEDVADWVAGQKRPDAALVDKAYRAVKRILDGDSELVQVWNEAKQGAEWRKSLEYLLARLSK